MQVAGRWLVTRATRVAVAAAGLLALLALQPEPARRGAGGATHVAAHARALALSEQARRYLLLPYRAFPTELMGSMVGDVRGQPGFVRRIAPAGGDPQQSR